MGVMKGRRGGRRDAPPRVQTGLAVIAAVALSACVAADQGALQQFSIDRADEVFFVGYDSIATRYVDDVNISDVAARGLDGLAEVDANVRIERVGDRISVLRNGATLASYARPAEGDVRAWSDLTVKVLKSSRDASMQVAAASPERLFDAVFDSALAELDEYSRYAGRQLARNHRDLRDGFGGIGFEYTLTPDHGLAVTMVLPHSPADDEGLEVGDVIIKIDDTAVAGLSRDDITEMLRGRVDSEVAMTVRRAGSSEPLTLVFERALILPPTVTAKAEDGIAFFRIASFNQRTAGSLAAAFARLSAGAELKGIVLDLRDNPGGLLDQAVAVADLFLDNGEIVETHGRHPDSNQRFDASGKDIAEGLPMVVLINGDSASAAEIVAAALQDQGRAVLVGSNTFGKGTVQNVIHLPNDGELTLTWSRIKAPSGYVFHQKGLMPAVCTSGPAPAAGSGVIDELRGGAGENGALLAAWRTAEEGDETTETLRESCPPSHDVSETDLEIARDVIDDSELYTQALKLGAPTIAATTVSATSTSTATR